MQNPFNAPPKVDQNNVAITGGTIDNVAITSSSVTGGTTAPSAFIMPEGTPVNAVAATGTVTFTGLPNVYVANVNATGTITFTGTPVENETFDVGAITFTFKALRSGVGEVTIDADNTQQAVNALAAIVSDASAVVTATSNLGVVSLTAVAAGAAGNLITLTEAATGTAVSGAGTLTNGVSEVLETVTVGAQVFTFVTLRAIAGEVTVGADAPGTATNFKTAVNTDMATVDADSSAGVVTLTAATKGITGNAIVLTENATNTTVSGAGTLTGGVDGTVAPANTTFADADYLYHTPIANTISGANWLRISLYSVPTELTIASDTVTPARTVHTIDTEADAASDNLATITTGWPSQLLLIRAAHADRTVVVKSNTGNILTGGSDISLDDTNKFLLLMYDSALSKWVVVGGSGIDLAAPGPIGGTTAGTVRMLYDEDVEAATDTLSANQCANGQISNYGQSGNVVLTLPACAAGMSFTFVAGSTAAFYYRIDPDANDLILLDGVAGANGKYCGLVTVTQGDWIHFRAIQTGASAYDWMATSGLGSWSLEA